ncbi:uncharacterized protein I303_105027 [Kwoniella dejecticola CBS 10117]|uniref:Uncharacterized protein n=1 Tax=Kwoniella dejecticola CBS 10117 TaxID=1296121 RepID=A0A1A6A3N5_9TREE|nr:uncharacterized protein I303_05527 [Kwoniella dejecticola CBS 10117]OBR84668.1 hypothetical protein I303_05527 [Kwoniella dejecticola CBS 10117]
MSGTFWCGSKDKQGCLSDSHVLLVVFAPTRIGGRSEVIQLPFDSDTPHCFAKLYADLGMGSPDFLRPETDAKEGTHHGDVSLQSSSSKDTPGMVNDVDEKEDEECEADAAKKPEFSVGKGGIGREAKKKAEKREKPKGDKVTRPSRRIPRATTCQNPLGCSRVLSGPRTTYRMSWDTEACKTEFLRNLNKYKKLPLDRRPSLSTLHRVPDAGSSTKTTIGQPDPEEEKDEEVDHVVVIDDEDEHRPKKRKTEGVAGGSDSDYEE